MISEVAYIWIYLPGQTSPVVCGALQYIDGDFAFRYARSYLERELAIPLATPDCPLGELNDEMVYLDNEINSALRDASPDAWGRNIMRREWGDKPNQDPEDLGEIDFILRAGPNRIGGLDATDDPAQYSPEESHAAPLEQLVKAAGLIDRGEPLDPLLDKALNHGTSVGGARPKALLIENGEYWIAKFSSTQDHVDMVGIEAGTMNLAMHCGIDVADARVVESLNKRVLLVKRFDRPHINDDINRRHMLSAMTLQNIDGYQVRRGDASYLELADTLRRYADNFTRDARELFRRMAFNVMIGNVDDHSRNHACFWDGKVLKLTPAYDLCPQPRTGISARQAMKLGLLGRESTLQNVLSQASRFGLDEHEAGSIVTTMREIVESHWEDGFREAGVPEGDINYLRRATILSPGINYKQDLE